MAFRVPRNYYLIRVHTPDGEVRWSAESDKSTMPSLAQVKKALTMALAMVEKFEQAAPADRSPPDT